jgi:HK97 family phage major capsid protein
VRETGFINRAAAVRQRTAADGVSAPTGGPTDLYGLKPRSDLTIAPVTYPIATIAHLMYVHKLTLDDEPRMRGLIDRDLIDGVKLAEDEAILYGNGVGENLTGINVQLSTENRDFFERNVYTLRAEERLALVVDRPESFVVGAFTTPA